MSESKKGTSEIVIALLSFIVGVVSAVFGTLQYFQSVDTSMKSDISQATANSILSKQLGIQETIVAVAITAQASNISDPEALREIDLLSMTKEALQATLVSLNTPGPNELAVVETKITPTPNKPSRVNERVVLANESDNNYVWNEGSPYITTKYVYEGDSAFISTGNNQLTGDLGMVGYESDEVRYINFKLYVPNGDASLVLQVGLDQGDWDHRWAFDTRPNSQGYNIHVKGQSVNIPEKEWYDVHLDLIDQLGAKPGQKINALAFSEADGSMIYDLVTFSASE